MFSVGVWAAWRREGRRDRPPLSCYCPPLTSLTHSSHSTLNSAELNINCDPNFPPPCTGLHRTALFDRTKSSVSAQYSVPVLCEEGGGRREEG